MSTVASYDTVKLFYLGDDMNIRCVMCDRLLIAMLHHVPSRFSWAQLDGAILEHLIRHHPNVAIEMGLALSQSAKQHRQNPAEQPQDGMTEPCQPIGCDNGIHRPGCLYAEVDNANQVDPLSLRGRLQT